MNCPRVSALAIGAIVASAASIGAQSITQLPKTVGQKTSQTVVKAKDELTFTDEEELQIGADVSAKLREKYGVVQDAAVHKYVTLVGTVLADNSSRPKLHWTFIVLDTDGINAFAAPGGFVHITRGALALIKSEAELADVLGHEIAHVTAKDTLDAIRNSKLEGAFGTATTKVTRSKFIENAFNNIYSKIADNTWSSKEETDADETGIALADAAGYAPFSLGSFLNRLADRNKGLTDRSGIFASHPETKKRVAAIERVIRNRDLSHAALVQARYSASIKYKSLPVQEVPQVVAPVETTAAAAPEPAKGGAGKFGLGGLKSLGKEKQSTSTIAATGSRGVNPDRDAKGGPNKAVVVVTVTAAELRTFRSGIAG